MRFDDSCSKPRVGVVGLLPSVSLSLSLSFYYSVRLSVTVVHFGQTTIGVLMISSQADSSSLTWVRRRPKSIEIDLAIFQQWRI